jgi:hypothetical protein
MLGPVLALALVGTDAAAETRDFSAALNSAPANYSGKCPVTIKFTGTITAKKAGKVQYKFIRSNGGSTPMRTLNFSAPGTKAVSTTWKLGGSSTPSTSGWQTIKILFPVSLESNQAHFKIQCDGDGKTRSSPPPAAKPTAPVISRFEHPGNCVAKGGRVVVHGRRFGTRPGKALALGGHDVHVDLPVASWSSNRIVVTLPNDPAIQEDRWYYIGIENTAHTKWLSNIDKGINVCRSAGKR